MWSGVTWVTRDFVGGRKSAVGARLGSDRSIARTRGIDHAAVLGAADERLPSPVKRRDQAIALPPIGSRLNSVLSECSGYSSACARRSEILAPWCCSICKANRAQRRAYREIGYQWSRTSRPFGLLCHPRHTSTDGVNR
jgi:hypothetical protein